MGGDLITSPAQRVGVIDRWCCQIPTHPHLVPQGGIVGQTIDRRIATSYHGTWKGHKDIINVTRYEKTGLIYTKYTYAYYNTYLLHCLRF